MSDENKNDEPKVQADNNGVAVGSLNIDGSVDGTIIVGNDNTVTTGYTAEQVAVLIAQIQSTFQPKPFDGRCPYKGLDVFEEEDAELFFGREKLVDDLASRVKESRTVFVTGPSGSGKSSLVRAGLIHALKQGAIKGSDRWQYATMKPGRDPFESLANAFSRLKSPELGNYFRKNANQVNVLHECAESTLTDNKNQRLVLFIDQFEEVFTQIGKEEDRVVLLNLLTHVATVENGRVIILFSMRSDFVSNCATYPQLNSLLNQQFVQIGAMQPEDLVSAIAQPALRVGLRIDPDLIAQIINEMKGEPGALPLMQFALKDLFDSQQEKSGVPALILNDYFQRGGIHKALERHADDSFSKLSKNEQELARSIFSGLIEIGRGTQDTKRTAMFDELVPANTKAENIEAIVQKLADARLLTTDETAGRDTVAISHEKLIDAWPWLKKLVNENRDVIALQNEIKSDAKEWDEHKRDSSYLYGGARLINAHEHLETKKLVLSGLAQDFVQAGRARQRSGQIVLVGGISTVIIILIAAVIIFAGLTKESQKQSQIALARQLAAQSQLDDDSTRSLLLAIESAKTIAPISIPSNYQALFDALGQDALQIMRFQVDMSNISISPNGKTASIPIGSYISVIDILTNKELYKLTHESKVTQVNFSPDGNFILSSSFDGTAKVWEATTGKEIAGMIFDDLVSGISASPDGKYAVATSYDNTAKVWEATTGKEIARMTFTNGVINSLFSPDGKFVISSGFDNTVNLWETATAKEVARWSFSSPAVNISISPDAQWLAIGDESGKVSIIDLSSNSLTPITLLQYATPVTTVSFSPDGRWLASASQDNIAYVWDIKNQEKIPLLGTDGSMSILVFSPDSTWLAGSGNDLIRLWDFQNFRNERIILHSNIGSITSMVFTSDAKNLVTVSGNQIAFLLLNIEKLIDSACVSAKRNLTHIEWQQYFVSGKEYRATCPQWPLESEATVTQIALP